MKTLGKIGVATGVVALFLLTCIGCWLPVDLLISVFAGWAFYLYRVAPEVRVDWSGLGMGLATMALLGGGLHSALGRWFTTGDAEGDTAERAWRMRWTASILLGVVVLFAAGIAVVGVTHQFGWLATSPERLWSDSGQAARRTQSRNNLHQFGLAMHNYHDAYSALPAGGTFNAAGQPLHSWETALLPYLDWAPQYEQIDLDRPWNAPANAEIFRQHIPVFVNPEFGLRFGDGPQFTADTAGFALSHYAANERLFGANTSVALHDIRDGTSNTILAGEVHARFRPWGHPVNWRDPARGINQSPDGFGSPFVGGAQFLLCDGSTRFISENIDPAVLKAIATPDAGDHIEEF
jgi:hypothetical protein